MKTKKKPLTAQDKQDTLDNAQIVVGLPKEGNIMMLWFAQGVKLAAETYEAKDKQPA